MALLQSVNVGTPRPSPDTDKDVTGIDKRPVTEPVEIREPGPRGQGGSGLAGDHICDLRNHGGTDQAVYAYAREDLDAWEVELGRPLASGCFGENLTTMGVDVTGALVGERWGIGDEVVLEVSRPRIPCRTFAGWLDERGWVKTFTQRAVPGAYLRVVRPGSVRVGDQVTVLHRPDHDVTMGLTFRALTAEPELLPRLLVADSLSEETKQRARRRHAVAGDE